VPQRLRRLFERPAVAAGLSFLFPGLGQAAAGRPNRGAIVAIPALAVLAVFALILLFARHSILNNALNDQWLVSLLILDLVALVYHVWAVTDAYVLARRQRGASPLPRNAMAVAAIVVLVSSTVAVHAYLADVDLSLRSTADCLHSPIPCWMLNGSSATDNQSVASPPSEGGDVIVPDATPTTSPGASTATASASVGPLASLPFGLLPDVQTTQNSVNWANDHQLNVLLVGVDQGPNRSDFLTDTMILLHVDMDTGQAAMIGLARNLYCIPMPKQIAVHYPNPKPQYACPSGTFGTDMLNGLWYEAAKNHPSYFPFYPRKACVTGDKTCQQANNVADYMRGIMALEQGVGALTGVTVDGTVLVNLPGFVTLVNDLGGIDINVPASVSDYPCGPAGTWAAKWRACDVCGPSCSMARRIHYGYAVSDGSGAVVPAMKADAAQSGGKQTVTWQQGADIAFVIKAGQQHMDGEWALAYARTRIYSTDYDRMKRQQLVLQAIRNKVDPCTLLPRLLPPSSLLADLGQAFWTDMPTDGSTLTTLAGLAQHITGSNVARLSLDPSTLHSPGSTTIITAAGWATAKNIVGNSLTNAPVATASSGGGGGFSC
jgi:anionic cell wall polymer biosynthesis LytR-Cps2A-Psr (LCP) family protein